MKKLPIGISTFSDIIKEDYVYVDKTKEALELINGGRYYFLSRPRRFGKSLFLDTLRSIFDGKKELFEGLYIYDKWDFKKYPIIYISFAAGDLKSKEEVLDKWDEILEFNEEALGVSCHSKIYDRRCFSRLIKEAYQKYNQKVVILVDEYDKPILDNIENTEIAREAREILKNFYSVIKGADEYLKFVFITGVSKFSKVSLFSGLNNLDDITLDPKYSTITGYTQNDIETTFSEHLIGQDFKEIKRWYNGYKFLGEGVYNPFDILLFISKGFSYESYWFSTGTPTFLLKLIEKNNYFLPNLEDVVKDRKMLDSFDVDYIELETLMWQTGYLTISKKIDMYGEIRYKLEIPNLEVKLALLGSIAEHLTQIHTTRYKDNIKIALFENHPEKLEPHLKALFASIPYHLFTNNPMFEREGYFVSVFYAYLKGLGVETRSEDPTNKGRIDMALHFPNAIYVMEFKVDSDGALKQIKEKKYYEKYLDLGKPIYLVGIEFSSKERNIEKLEWEKL